MTDDAAKVPAAPQQSPARSAMSKAQVAANARRPPIDNAAALRRFTSEQIPRLKRYRDYREMLDKQKDLDAIVVATPDHMHAVIALAAMDLDKHVYVQKPLCWSVEEARALAKKAREKSTVVTQMGNQGHSSDGSRTGYEYIRGGAIGDVREVHVWTNRPLGFWPQGIPRPAPLGAATGAPRPLRFPSGRVTPLMADALSREAAAVPSTHRFHSQTPTSIKLATLPAYLGEWTKSGFEEAMFLGALVAGRMAFCLHNLDVTGAEAQRKMSLSRVEYK